MFDPITLSVAAGAAALLSGGIKTLKEWLTRRNEASITVQVGDKSLQVSGPVSPDQIRAITEVLTQQLNKAETDAPPPAVEKH